MTKLRATINLPDLAYGESLEADQKDARIKPLVDGGYLVKDDRPGAATRTLEPEHASTKES